MMEALSAPSGLTVEVMEDVLLVVPQGLMTEEALRQCEEQVLALARQTGLRRALYDARHMIAPEAHIALMQQQLDGELGDLRLRRAIVVPGTRIAYLARIAFFEGEDRVFYDDVEAALAWLRS